MTREQRFRIILWSVFGFLGLIRLMYAVFNHSEFGLVLGFLWVVIGAGKAWAEARKIDEGAPPVHKQPDRAPKKRR